MSWKSPFFGRRGVSTRLGFLICLIFPIVALVAGTASAEVWPDGVGIEVSRDFSETGGWIPLGESCRVTWTLDISTDQGLSGLFYSEQFPAWLQVDLVDALVDGAPISTFHEIGEQDEVGEGLVPHRFVFWEAESGWLDLVLQTGQTLVLEYDLTSDTPGQVATAYNGWCGLLTGGEEWAAGGYQEDDPVLQFGETPVLLESLDVLSAVDHLRVSWTMSVQGDSELFRLQRGESADPWQSQALDQVLQHEPGTYRYDDYDVLPGHSYWYWIAVVDETGHVARHLGPATGSLLGPASVVAFEQNFPNPFNPHTTLRFTLVAETRVELSIYSAQGRLLRGLASGSWPAGGHEVSWDGRDDAGRDLASGLYFARLLREGEAPQIRKLTLIR